jgi:hypothetical protein
MTFFVGPGSKAAEKGVFAVIPEAKRGICFFASAKKKADPSGKVSPRDDKL